MTLRVLDAVHAKMNAGPNTVMELHLNDRLLSHLASRMQAPS